MIINANTKKGRNWIVSTSTWQGTRLEDVYGNASVFKHRAYNDCYDRYCNDTQARNFRITSHTAQQFTIAWDTIHIDQNTGEVLPCRHVETAYNIYDIVG